MSATGRRGALAALTLAGALAATLAARGLDAQTVSSPALETSETRLAAALDAPTHAAVRALLADAHRRGLPDAPLTAKALEGVEKGAPATRIEHAVRAMLGRLETARRALAPVVGDAEVVAGADALAVGVPGEVLRRMRALSPRRSTAVALGVLAQLVSRGVPVSRAADAVTELLRGGAQPAQLLALDGAVQADVASGVKPEIALELRSRVFLAGLPGAPASGVGLADAPGVAGNPVGVGTVPTSPGGAGTNAPPSNAPPPASPPPPPPAP